MPTMSGGSFDDCPDIPRSSRHTLPSLLIATSICSNATVAATVANSDFVSLSPFAAEFVGPRDSVTNASTHPMRSTSANGMRPLMRGGILCQG